MRIFCHSVGIISSLFILFLLPFGAGGCKKDFAVPENSLSSREGTEGVYQSVEDEIDSVYEFYDDERDTIGYDDTDYQTDANATTITAVNGEKAIGDSGIETNLNCTDYKYYGRYVVSKEGSWFDITLNRDDSIRNLLNIGDGIIYDSLVQIDGKHLKVRIRSEFDTLQTKTSRLTMYSKKPWSNGVFPSISRKMKFVGKTNEQLYGNNRWMENYWKFYMNTQNAVFPTGSQLIDQTYEVKAGDILSWHDGHTATVMPGPFVPTSYIVEATKTLPRYRVNRFWLSEMNSRCKGEKTIKMVWMKSYKIPQTLKGANKLRGNPIQFQRKVQ